MAGKKLTDPVSAALEFHTHIELPLGLSDRTVLDRQPAVRSDHLALAFAGEPQSLHRS